MLFFISTSLHITQGHHPRHSPILLRHISEKKLSLFFYNPNGNTKQHNAPLYTENSVHGSPDMRCRYAFLVVQREAAAQKSRPPLQDRRISRDRA
jgi:hypothetical protein